MRFPVTIYVQVEPTQPRWSWEYGSTDDGSPEFCGEADSPNDCIRDFLAQMVGKLNKESHSLMDQAEAKQQQINMLSSLLDSGSR